MCAILNRLYAVKSLIISPTFYIYKPTKQITYEKSDFYFDGMRNDIMRQSNGKTI